MKLQDVTLKAMGKMLTWVEATEIAGMPNGDRVWQPTRKAGSPTLHFLWRGSLRQFRVIRLVWTILFDLGGEPLRLSVRCSQVKGVWTDSRE
jgi:hypothetical protein